jgi:hypothetical protein
MVSNGARSGRCDRAWLDGFTVSEFDLVTHLLAAVVEQARKHRKRSPEELRIEQQRKSASDYSR